MNEGFQMKRKYEEGLHLETLRLLRYSAYTTYIGIPTKKTHKKSTLTKFYPLPNDPKHEIMSLEDAKVMINKREPLITNGKLRGYRENGTDELYNKEGKLIGYIREDIIEYIN